MPPILVHNFIYRGMIMQDPRYLTAAGWPILFLKVLPKNGARYHRNMRRAVWSALALVCGGNRSLYPRQKRAADKAGIAFDEQHWPQDITQDECKARILAMNDDETVIGIILQRPVPEHMPCAIPAISHSPT